MAINITSLFQDILESPEQKQQRQMAEGFARSQNAVSGLTGLATAAAPLVGTMAELQGRRTEDLQRGAGRLLGRDVRSTSEKVSDALKGFNPQDPQSVTQTAQLLRGLGLGAQAAQLSSMALEEQQKKKLVNLETQGAQQTLTINEEAIRSAESDRQSAAARTQAIIDNRPRLASIVSESSMPTSKKAAVITAVNSGAYDSDPAKLIDIAFPENPEKYKVVGNAIFDTSSGTFVTPPEGTSTPTEFMSNIDPDQYDPQSISEFLRAQSVAATPEERNLAYQKLRPRASDGYQWASGFDENNQPISLQRPIPGSKPYQDIIQEVSAANASAESVIANASNTVEVLDKMIYALENNEVETGIPGMVLSYAPGTNEANIKADLETAYSNMGIGELERMRANSANGASGFGQLTAPELSMLKTRIRNLTQTQNREQQVENMKYVRGVFEDMGNRAKTDWDVDQWIGVAPRPSTATSADTVTGPSGVTFTVVPK